MGVVRWMTSGESGETSELHLIYSICPTILVLILISNEHMESFENESYDVEMLSPRQNSVYRQTYKHHAKFSKVFLWQHVGMTHSHQWKQYQPHCHGWSQILCNFRCVSTFQQCVTITCTVKVKNFHPLVKNICIVAVFRSSSVISTALLFLWWNEGNTNYFVPKKKKNIHRFGSVMNLLYFFWKCDQICFW